MTNNIWVTSDSHYGHANIAGKSVSKWNSGYRHFDSIEEMNSTLVENINKCVKENDTLYFAGDWNFGNVTNMWEFRKQIICKDIRLTLGNHDQNIRRNVDLVIPADDIEIFKNLFGYSPAILAGTISGTVKAQKLFSKVSDVIQFKYKDQQYFMSHYPHLSWDNSGRGSINIHGHEHGGFNHLNVGQRRIDVGIDSAYEILGEFRPFSIDEIFYLVGKNPIPKHH